MSTGKALSPFELLVLYAEHAERRQAIVDDYQEAKDTYLAFRAGEGNFLLNIKYVLEITIGLTGITSLPFSPKWILGLTSSRGDVFSVIDFRWFNNSEDNSKSSRNPNYILLRDDGVGYILKVDEILGSGDYAVTDQNTNHAWLDGVYDLNGQICQRINVTELISDPKFIQNL